MNKQPIAATELQKKPYAKPQISVVEIKCADIICTSGSTRSAEEDDSYLNNF